MKRNNDKQYAKRSWKGELKTDDEDQWFSTGGDGVPAADIKQCLQKFLVVTTEHGGNATGI